MEEEFSRLKHTKFDFLLSHVSNVIPSFLHLLAIYCSKLGFVKDLGI